MAGNVLIAGSKDCTIWMWLANTGHCVHVLTGHEGPVTCGLFTSDGKAIASGAPSFLWCMGGGREVETKTSTYLPIYAFD